MLDERLAQVLGRLDPVGVPGQDHPAGAHAVDGGVISPGRHGAAVAQRPHGRDQPPPGADDHGVGTPQVFLGAIADRAHALGYHSVLHRNPLDPGVALHAALLVAIDEIVVVLALDEPEATVP